MSEQAMNIAKTMYDSRRTSLSLLGPEKYKKRLTVYQPFIKEVMRNKNCNEIMATKDVIEKLIEGGYDGMPVMLALAACVELIEPTEGL